MPKLTLGYRKSNGLVTPNGFRLTLGYQKCLDSFFNADTQFEIVYEPNKITLVSKQNNVDDVIKENKKYQKTKIFNANHKSILIRKANKKRKGVSQKPHKTDEFGDYSVEELIKYIIDSADKAEQDNTDDEE